jgi:hypothetical protein
MQRAYYNGHYKNHGGKVQHVLQADGMAHSFTRPIGNHDALILCYSSMHLMLTSLFINGQPALTDMDKAYSRTPHFCPHHTEAECQMMAPNKIIVREKFDKQHRRARLAVEDSFSQQVTKFPHSENCRSHKITQGGLSNRKYLHCLWDLQTFFNLFTCSADSQVVGAHGVTPPSVHDYL